MEFVRCVLKATGLMKTYIFTNWQINPAGFGWEEGTGSRIPLNECDHISGADSTPEKNAR